MSYGTFQVVFASFENTQIENTRIYGFKVKAKKPKAGLFDICKSKKDNESKDD